MKKLLLILLCLPMIGLSQTYTHKMDSLLIYESNQIVKRYEFNYDSDNNNLLCLGFSINTQDNDKERIENSFDINNNLIKTEESVWNVSFWEGERKREYTYDLNSNIILMERFGWSNQFSTWILDFKKEYTYDSNGRLILMDALFWNVALSSWVEYAKHEYSYDTNNNLVIKEKFYWDDILSVWQVENKSEYTYDINNNLTLIEVFIWDSSSSLWGITSKYEYIYDINNNISSFSQYQWGSGGFNLFANDLYFYDSSLLTANISYPYSSNELVESHGIIYSPISSRLGAFFDYTYHYSPVSTTGILNLEGNPNRKLETIVDILGKETTPKSNTPFIEIYDDGTVEKKLIVE
jgi:hypothetical protein